MHIRARFLHYHVRDICQKTYRSPMKKAPYWAIIIPGIIGFLLSLTGEGDLLILMAVFGATISYVLMMLSHINYVCLALNYHALIKRQEEYGRLVSL